MLIILNRNLCLCNARTAANSEKLCIRLKIQISQGSAATAEIPRVLRIVYC